MLNVPTLNVWNKVGRRRQRVPACRLRLRCRPRRHPAPAALPDACAARHPSLCTRPDANVPAHAQVDACADPAVVQAVASRREGTVCISGLTGEGLPELMERVSAKLQDSMVAVHVLVPYAQGGHKSRAKAPLRATRRLRGKRRRQPRPACRACTEKGCLSLLGCASGG